MILYLDTSALVKRYLQEDGSTETNAVIRRARETGTAVVARAEGCATFAKVVRTGAVSQAEAKSAMRGLRSDWEDLYVLLVSDALADRACQLAWSHGLRGYDAVHLAAALAWNDGLGAPLTFATFDRQLWHVAGEYALAPPRLVARDKPLARRSV